MEWCKKEGIEPMELPERMRLDLPDSALNTSIPGKKSEEIKPVSESVMHSNGVTVRPDGKHVDTHGAYWY